MHRPAQVTKPNKFAGIMHLPDDPRNLPESYRREMDKRPLLDQNALLSTPRTKEMSKMGAQPSSRAALAMILAVIGTTLILGSAQHLKAQDFDTDQERILQGYAVAPVPLNMSARNAVMVLLGSYYVNTVGDCNGCHSSGTPASLFLYPYATGGNPYFNQPAKIDPTVYLNGGAQFYTVGTPTGPLGYAGPVIVSRNLTPNYAGLPEGGHTLSEFMQIMRTGIDFDHIHPPCSQQQLNTINNPGSMTLAQLQAAVNNCIPTGVIPGTSFDNAPNGNLLQIMPWAAFANLTDYDLEAIYEYLSAIPCINNTLPLAPAGAPDELLNNCGPGSPVPAARPGDNVNSILKLGASGRRD